MKINIILQNKGGIGKSYIASLIAQYYINKGITPVCVDTDTINKTFSHYKALNVHYLDLLENNEISSKNIYKLVEFILNADTEAVIVDCWSALFIPICSYFMENDVLNMLKKAGHEVVFHTIITGGQAFDSTANELEFICNTFPEKPVILWQNEYFGSTDFEDSSFYESLKNKVSGIVKLTALHQQTFGYDLERMLSKYLTFEEVEHSDDFRLMPKQRLKQTWEKIYKEIKKANL